jgi:hypothetical protein
MNIWAYFDESGTHKGSRALSVAGFLARADEWGAFTVEWEDALAEWGLPFFHMVDFENRRKGYDWPEEVRRARISRLLAIIDRHVLGSVGIGISLGDYDAVFPEGEVPEGPNIRELAPGIWAPGSQEPGEPEPPTPRPGDLRRKSGGPYGLAATAAALDVTKLIKGLTGDPHVAYVFEAGAVGAGQILKIFQDILADESTRRETRVLSITFEDKRQFPQLQAADLLAYELHKHLPRQLGLEVRPTRYTLRELAKSPRRWGWLNADELRKWHWVLGRGLYYSEGTWRK